MNKVALLIPHYNNVEGLLRSISSIHQDEILDVYIVDDGSSDILDEKQVNANFRAQGQCNIIYNARNLGIENALNIGLEVILSKDNYTYIARLDCGDTNSPMRFLKQQKFLDLNPDIAMLGTHVSFVDEHGTLLYHLDLPLTDQKIRKKMYVNAMLIHPTIMFRSSILETVGVYPTEFEAAEDFAFFFNVIKKFKVANLNERLVTCELSPKGISNLKRKHQAKNRILIILRHFHLGFYPVYGLIRSCILYIIPLKYLIRIKRIL